MTTSLEILACLVIGILWMYSFWLDSRNKKAQSEYIQKINDLQREIDRLNINIDELHSDLRLIFPTHRFNKN